MASVTGTFCALVGVGLLGVALTGCDNKSTGKMSDKMDGGKMSDKMDGDKMDAGKMDSKMNDKMNDKMEDSAK